MAGGRPARRHDVGRGDDLWTVAEIAIETGCSESHIAKRIAYGITGAALLEPRKDHKLARQAGERTVLMQRSAAENPRKRGNPRGYAIGSCTYDVGGGRRLTQKQIAAEVGICVSTVSNRIAYGYTGAALLLPKVQHRSMQRLIETSNAAQEARP